MAERYLNNCLRMVKANVQGDPERCKGSEIITQTIAAKTCGGKESPETKESKEMYKLEEQIMRAKIKMNISEGMGMDSQGKTADWTEEKKEGSKLLARAEMIRCWKKVREGLQKLKIPAKALFNIEIPGITHLEWAGNVTKAVRTKAEKAAFEKRIQAWRRRLSVSMDSNATKEERASLKRIMKADRPPPIVAIGIPKEKEGENKGVQIGQQRLAVKSKEIHEQLAREWHEIFNQPRTATYQEFKERFGRYVKKGHCEVGELTVEKIREAIEAMSDERSVASCGWRVVEIKQIPDLLLEPFVELMKDVEEGGEWPYFIKEIFTTMIEKEEEPEIMEVKAYKFAAPEPLGMRPINNFSPWYSIWSKARLKDMEE